MAISVRQVAEIMDPVQMGRADPRRRPVSLSELTHRHRRAAQAKGPPSLLEILRRHAGADTRRIRFLQLNTYLLDARFRVIDYVEKGVGGAVQLLLCLGFAGPEILGKALGLTGKQVTCALLFPPPIPVVNPVYSACVAIPGTDALVKWLIGKVGSAVDIALKLGVPTATLLQAFGIDINITVKSKRLIDERATEIGQRLAGYYDLVSLCEVWRQSSVDRILQGWGSTPPHFLGNGRPGVLNYLEGAYKDLGSGLLVVSPGVGAAKVAEQPFDNDGVRRSVEGCADLGPLVDADRWATKGLLLTRIDAGVGAIDLYSTHLNSGGDLLPIKAPTEEEKLAVRLDQVREFVSFFRAKRDPRNVAIFAGDFNINAGTAGYEALLGILREIPLEDGTTTGFEDFWLFGVSDPTANQLSGTNRSGDDDDPDREKDFAKTCHMPPPGSLGPDGAPNPRDFFCDDAQPADRGRIDFLFVERPHPGHAFNLDLSRIRRRSLGRGDAEIAGQSKENDREYYLSDHLGLDTLLIASRRY